MIQSNKNRLFEVMSRVDKSFKPKLNEELEMYSEPDDISYAKSRGSNYGRDEETYSYTEKQAVEYVGGIDNWNAMSSDEKSDIMHQISKPDGMNEMSNWGVNKMNPKYSHFAVLKDTGKIINGWEYRGYDPEELKLDKNHYFFNDIRDLQINPKIVNVVTGKYLQRKGIDPYDSKNWHKNDVDGTDIYTL